jgi:hypothetical protein
MHQLISGDHIAVYNNSIELQDLSKKIASVFVQHIKTNNYWVSDTTIIQKLIQFVCKLNVPVIAQEVLELGTEVFKHVKELTDLCDIIKFQLLIILFLDSQ